MIAETKTLATIHTLRGAVGANFRFEACAKLRSNDDVLTRRHRSAIAMCRVEEGCFEPTNVVPCRGRLFRADERCVAPRKVASEAATDAANDGEASRATHEAL